jgi:hypothetical protein
MGRFESTSWIARFTAVVRFAGLPAGENLNLFRDSREKLGLLANRNKDGRLGALCRTAVSSVFDHACNLQALRLEG